MADGVKVLRDVGAQVSQKIFPVILVWQRLHDVFIVDVSEENVAPRSGTADKVDFAWSQLSSSGASVKHLLFQRLREQAVEQLCSCAFGVAHRRYECLGFELEKERSLDLEETAPFRNKDVEKVIVQLGKPNLLGPKDTRDERGQICLPNDVDLSRVLEAKVGRRQEGAFG